MKFGRVSYYNNANFINYFFYNTMFFTLMFVHFAFSNYFSNLNVYKDLYMTFNGILFIPFIMSSHSFQNRDIFPEDYVVKDTLKIESAIYYKGKNNEQFNLGKYFKWILIALVESLWIYVSLELIFEHGIFEPTRQAYFPEFSFLLYVSFLFVQNTVIPFIVFRWGFWSVLGTVGTFLAFIIYQVATNESDLFNFEHILNSLMPSHKFWLIFFYFFLGSIFFCNFIYTLKRHIFSGIRDKIRSLHTKRTEEEVLKLIQRWKVEEKNAHFLVKFILR